MVKRGVVTSLADRPHLVLAQVVPHVVVSGVDHHPLNVVPLPPGHLVLVLPALCEGTIVNRRRLKIIFSSFHLIVIKGSRLTKKVPNFQEFSLK